MAMGIVSDKDFNSERDKLSESKPAVTAEIIDTTKGRGKGNVEVPNALRNVIGDESQTNGRASAIEMARQFGISPSSVSAYNTGATSTASFEERPNASVVNQAKLRVATRARKKLMSAIGYITKEKLEVASAKDLAGIAKDMSAVVKVMEPESDDAKASQSNGPTFVFYAPQFRDERHFDVVNAKD